MKKIFLFCIIVLFMPIVFSFEDTYPNTLIVSGPYCMMGGNCTLNTLNVSTFNAINTTVTNQNITGVVNAYGYNINGTPLSGIFLRNGTDFNLLNGNIINLTASGNISAKRFISTIPTGVSPIQVASTTVVTSLNADLWDGYNFADYLNQAVKTTSTPLFNSVNIVQTGAYKINNVNIISAADTQHFQISDFIYGDTSLNRLGIGTGASTPAFTLHVVGSGDTAIATFSGTSYGGGTIILRALDAFAWSGLNIYDENDVLSASFQYGNSGTGGTFTDQLVFAGRKTTTPVTFWTYYDDGDGEALHQRVTIAPNGNMGIGITDPTAKLDVVGNLKVSENINVTGKFYAEGYKSTYTSGSAYVCVYNNGTVFVNETCA